MILRLALLVLLATGAARADPAPVRITGAFELKSDGRIVRLPPARPSPRRPAERPR